MQILNTMIKKVFFLLAMFTCIFASCSDGGSEEPVIPPTQKPEVNNTPTITIDPTIQSSGLSFDTSASEKSITFSTTSDWTLSIAETRSGTEWCTASPTSGGKGTATVKFKTTENTESEDRTVAVTIKAGAASKTFTVTQKGNKSLLVTTKKYELPKEGSEIEIEVKSNVEYEMTIAESCKEWITEATGRALTTHKHILAIAASEEAVKREGEITFKSGDIVETVKVYQAGEAVLLLSKNELTVGEAGETITVDIKSNVDFGVQMPNADWIKEEASGRGMSSHTLRFVISENETFEARSAEIVFYDKNSDLKNTLKVIQSAKEQKEASYENGVATLVEAGTLKKLLGDDYLSITSLKVVGPINGDDVYYLRKMLGGNNFSEADRGKLTTLDLSEATIVEGGEWYYYDEYYTPHYYTSNNTIGEYMFNNCANLKNIILPDSVTEISGYAFADCYSLTSVTIPDSVTSIGDYAFYDCSALTSITIPDSVTSIGKNVFAHCSSLTSVTIPDSVTSIGDDAFHGCLDLTSVTIGNGVTEIGWYAFYRCSSLTSVIIPDSVTEIGGYAFYGCSALTSVTIPDSVISIGGNAFEDCSVLTSVTIGNGVTKIGGYAFYGCSALTSVTIPDSVNVIGGNAFQYCSALTSVYCYAQYPPSLSIYNTIFAGINSEATLYVPARCGSEYKSSSWGNYFKKIIEMEE